MKAEIYPGILTHTIEEYLERLEMAEKSAATWVHLDFADGQFVPNITVMPHEIMSIPTKLKLEAHLMMYAPERYFSDLTVAGVQRVLLHREAYQSLEECMVGLKEAGNYFNEVGLVINPDTALEPYADLPISVIQVMGYQPGFSGQPFMETTYSKLEQVRAQNLPYIFAVDGGVSEDNIQKLQQYGATRFVISSHLFVQPDISPSFQHFIQLVSPGGV